MKWITNNFSLNMISTDKNYRVNVEFIPELQFKVESKTAKNRLSKIDVCQELNLFPHKGTVAADVGDTIFVAQLLDGDLIFRKLTVEEIP